MNKITAVIFDLDGTTVNTLGDLANATNYMLSCYGYPEHSIDEYRYLVGNGMRKLVERALPEEKRSTNNIDAAHAVFKEYYDKHSMDTAREYDGMRQLLSLLKSMDIKLAICTNKADNSAQRIINCIYPHTFDVVRGHIDGIPTKPAPNIVDSVLSLLQTKKDNCLFVGDSSVDMQTAVNSGIKSIGVLWGFRERAELESNGADYLVDKPYEIGDIIISLNN